MTGRAADGTAVPPAAAAPSRAEGVALGEPTAPGSAVYTVVLKSDDTGHSWSGTEKIAFTNPGKAAITEFWIRLWGNGDAGCGECRRSV
ncbi:hypothetical protein ACFQ9X_36775 [Catenulispora yoronensis]